MIYSKKNKIHSEQGVCEEQIQFIDRDLKTERL